MTDDDLLRTGLEQARSQAEYARRYEEAVARDLAYTERRVTDFVEAVGRTLQLMRERGNPGAERFAPELQNSGVTHVNHVFFPLGKPGWRLGHDHNLNPVLRPDGMFAHYSAVGWVKAADYARLRIEAHGESLDSKKRGPSMGDGAAWQQHVDGVVGLLASDLGGLLHKHGIDVP